MSAGARTVVHFTDTVEFGGAERMLLTLLGGLDRERWRPVLMHEGAPGTDQLLREAARLGIVTRCVPRVACRRDALRLPDVVRALRRDHPAVFHAHLCWPLRCSYAIVGARLAGIPVVVATQHLYSRIWSRRARLRQAAVSLAVDRYIAVSEDMGARLRACPELRSPVEVIPNGIALPPVGGPRAADVPGGARRERPERRLVVTVARLVRRKGIHFLVDAAAGVPDVDVWVVGDGAERADLEHRALASGVADRVRFLGHRTDVPELLAAADVFVLPSSFEGLPISVLEAMAAGTPVVATDVGGTREIVVHGENGLLVPPERPDALAAALRVVLDDPELARRLAAAGRRSVSERFAVEHMATRTMRLYDDLLASRGWHGRR